MTALDILITIELALMLGGLVLVLGWHTARELMQRKAAKKS